MVGVCGSAYFPDQHCLLVSEAIGSKRQYNPRKNYRTYYSQLFVKYALRTFGYACIQKIWPTAEMYIGSAT